MAVESQAFGSCRLPGCTELGPGDVDALRDELAARLYHDLTGESTAESFAVELVAAGLSLVHEMISSNAIVFDPDQRLTSDVLVMDGDTPLISVQARQKPASRHDVWSHSEKVQQDGATRLMFVCLHPSQSELDVRSAVPRHQPRLPGGSCWDWQMPFAAN